jgi:oligoribonuclease (3'-5' exoribonuclease)
MNPLVREMHTKNGLFDAIQKAADVRLGDYGDASYINFEILGWLESHVPTIAGPDRQEIALGGSGVSHFDVRWINEYLPAFGMNLHRCTVDVGVIRRFIENVAGVPGLVPVQHRDLSHRALDDARDHLAEARVYRSMFRNGFFPSVVATGLLPPTP